MSHVVVFGVFKISSTLCWRSDKNSNPVDVKKPSLGSGSTEIDVYELVFRPGSLLFIFEPLLIVFCLLHSEDVDSVLSLSGNKTKQSL